MSTLNSPFPPGVCTCEYVPNRPCSVHPEPIFGGPKSDGLNDHTRDRLEPIADTFKQREVAFNVERTKQLERLTKEKLQLTQNDTSEFDRGFRMGIEAAMKMGGCK